MAEFIRLYEENPDPRRVRQIVEVLRNGGVIIYPTDTVYGMGCDITNQKAVEKICRIKGINPKKHNFSFVCADLSNISQYTRVITKPVFKMMKKAFPGPFTFILPATNELPKTLQSTRKNIGIRVPDHEIPRLLVERLGNPIITASLKNEEGDVIEHPNEIDFIYEQYKHQVDLVIDGGWCGITSSTVIDATTDDFELVRQGLGDLSEFL